MATNGDASNPIGGLENPTEGDLMNTETAPHVLLVEGASGRLPTTISILQRAGIVVTEAHDVAQARVLIKHAGSRFDAAVLNHQLPDGDSRELVAELVGCEPSCSALILAARGDQELAREYRQRGAFRLIAKSIGENELLASVHATMHDTLRWRSVGIHSIRSSTEPRAVVVDVEQAAARLAFIAKLSPTERKVAHWVLEGFRDAKIAEMLGRAERTAKRHVGQVLAKAKVPNRASLWEVLRKDGDTQLAPAHYPLPAVTSRYQPLPADNRARPGKARAERGHHHDRTVGDPALLSGLV
jgi:two-component system response regulator TtrR